MGYGHPEEAELDDILLESFEVKLVNFPFAHKFYIDVPEHVVDVLLRGNVEEPVIFEHFSQLHCCQDLFSALVVLDCLSVVVGVHCTRVCEEKVP